jgi:septum formation protein
MLILASESRTRKALLAGAGLAFEARPAGVNEREIEAAAILNGATPILVAQELAEAKATAIDGAVVIGADQVLALDGELLHKTRDLEAARRQLDRLRGKTHELHAAVALAVKGRVVWSTVDTAELTMHDFSDTERDRVLALEGEAVLGSVGAYRIEGPSIRLFERVAGDYFTILGLPLLPLLAALRVHAPEVFS